MSDEMGHPGKFVSTNLSSLLLRECAAAWIPSHPQSQSTIHRSQTKARQRTTPQQTTDEQHNARLAMVSRDRMESFAGLLFLCLIFLAQEIRMPKASFGEKAIRNPAKVSWMQSSSAKCTDGSSSRSALDEMDCAILPEQRLCRAPQVVASDAAHSKGSTATTATISSTPMAMPYQCAGPDYTTFGQALTDYRQNVAENGATWGRRLYGLPASQNILFFGNSRP